MITHGVKEFIAVICAIRRCDMANKELAYKLAVFYLDEALRTKKIARQTYEFLLQKINKKYNPIVPKNKAI